MHGSILIMTAGLMSFFPFEQTISTFGGIDILVSNAVVNTNFGPLVQVLLTN